MFPLGLDRQDLLTPRLLEVALDTAAVLRGSQRSARVVSILAIRRSAAGDGKDDGLAQE